VPVDAGARLARLNKHAGVRGQLQRIGAAGAICSAILGGRLARGAAGANGPATRGLLALNSLLRVVRNQSKNLNRLLRGQAVAAPSLSSMTLGRDDIELAQHALADRAEWCQPEWREHYERAFAAWNGSYRAFAFKDGRVALSAALSVLELQPGDEVILPGYTCVVVDNSLRFAGLQPVYADIEQQTYGLDIDSVRRRITPKTRAILLQHLYGLVCRDFDDLLTVARDKNLWVIEDCAHATGALYRDVKVGNFGDIGFYSSEKTKVFTTGRGGVAVTNNHELADRLGRVADRIPVSDELFVERQLRILILNYYRHRCAQKWWRGDIAELKHGRSRIPSTSLVECEQRQPPDYMQRMSPALARLGLNQLAKVDAFNVKRRSTAQRWDAWCEAHGYAKPVVIDNSVPVFLRYPVMVSAHMKADIKWGLDELGVGIGVWFSSNLHPIERSVPGCPNADDAVDRCINFPCLLELE
jgi:dTDP-4-amino-4,6-dideoxygalactose transaminase